MYMSAEIHTGEHATITSLLNCIFLGTAQGHYYEDICPEKAPRLH